MLFQQIKYLLVPNSRLDCCCKIVTEQINLLGIGVRRNFSGGERFSKKNVGKFCGPFFGRSIDLIFRTIQKYNKNLLCQKLSAPQAKFSKKTGQKFATFRLKNCVFSARAPPSKLVFNIIYSRGIGPTYELYSSSRRPAVVPQRRP